MLQLCINVLLGLTIIVYGENITIDFLFEIEQNNFLHFKKKKKKYATGKPHSIIIALIQ